MTVANMRALIPCTLLTAAAISLSACGTSRPAPVSTPTAPSGSIAPARAAVGLLQDWPEFGLDAQRTDATQLATGITAADVGHLHSRRVSLPGTVDSSPIYLHGVTVDGAQHDAIFVTTTYGRTLAVDAQTGAILWTFTPPGYHSWAGSSQITTTSPVADPDRRSIYAASPNGLIHKLSVADGAEQAGWPARVTLDPKHEKLAAALNIDGGDVVATTGGYLGDAPPYQGHVVLIDRTSGQIQRIFNTLCSGRQHLIEPSSCRGSDSAILSRAGAVVEPGSGRLLLSTGNGPFDGREDFGDSVIELTFPDLSVRQSFTPTDQAHLQATDMDLGSSAPVLVGSNRILIAGKDGVLRVLARGALDGHGAGSAASARRPLGGEVQRLSAPGGGELFTTPAVWRGATVFIADGEGTAAYVLRRGLLYRAWQTSTAGTSPIVAGGLLYVYDPNQGGIRVYEPSTGRLIAKLAGSPGHWNSPIVVDGHVIEPEGDANQHLGSGAIEIFSR